MAVATSSTLTHIALASSSRSKFSCALIGSPKWLGLSASALSPRFSSRLLLLDSSLTSFCPGFASPSRLPCYAVSDFGSLNNPAFVETDEGIPMPVVHIDQDSDVSATVVHLSFGDRLGALLDTMRALKELGLDVVKGNVTTDASVTQTRLSITRSDTGRKVENPDMIEAIRLTIIRNLLKYHPESSQRLAMGETFGVKAPGKKLDVDIATHIMIVANGPKRSLLSIETADKPGLLTEMVQIMNDISVTVESAEIDTEGLVAKDTFHVSYHGQALSKSLAEVLTNCLRFHLRRPQSEDESY